MPPTNSEDQVRVSISRRNRVVQLYPQALVASYDTQGDGGGIRTRLQLSSF
jgi:hypothetical protein